MFPRILKYLHSNTWLDSHTQAIFVEFTVYNANVNLFCIVTFMLETTAIGEPFRCSLNSVTYAKEDLRFLCFYCHLGAFQFRSELHSVRLYQSTGGLHIFVMASEIIYFLFIIYYMFVQVH